MLFGTAWRLHPGGTVVLYSFEGAILSADNQQHKHAQEVERRAEKIFAQQLTLERDYIDQLYRRFDDVRAETAQKLAQVRRNQAVGGHQNRSERDSFAAHYEDRLAQLNAVDARLAFGRLDTRRDGENVTRYIGRIGLTDEEQNRLLMDWRAPEAGMFYQATAFTPMGVRRRRHLMLEGRTVVNLEDEVFDTSMLRDSDILHGEGALLAALNKKRTGRMGDIVATIQAEQDAIIRSDLAGVRVVQGGPGTGKTAVALHRAAYLLYTNRERLAKAGVLVVGPSNSFMWYIERVLPSLGETGVVMASLSSLYPGLQAVPESNREVAALKGELRMVQVIERAVADRQKVPVRTQRLNVEGTDVELTTDMVRSARARARATGKPHNEARETFVKILLRELTNKLDEQLNKAAGRVVERPYLQDDVRDSLDVRRALNLAWMPLSAETLLRSLFSKRHYLDSAARDMSDRERELLVRAADAPFTEADVPLLDEAAELLGDFSKVTGAAAAARAAAEHRANLENATKALENVHQSLADIGAEGVVTAEQIASMNEAVRERMTAAAAAQSDRTWAYGHIVVDEAQELSPMQWRLLMRRCPMKSFTVVGDIAQASAATAASSWSQALGPFVGERFTVDELTINYRTPAQIADAAVAVARACGYEVSAPRAVREGNWAPLVHRVPQGQIITRTVECVNEEVAHSGGALIGVICPSDFYGQVVQAVASAHAGRVGTGDRALENQVMVLTPWEAKGLEFDVVVIVEPQQLIDDVSGAVGDLYVSMTRPTQRLHLVGSRMPAGLGTGDE